MSDARDGARDALRPPASKLFWLDRVYRWVSAAISFGLYFLLGNVAAYLFSLLTYERWDGGILLTGAGIGVLLGLASGRKAYLGFGAESGDSHGSARFAHDSEIRTDLAGDTGLIVGRELRGRKLLRYDGPAHLLTIAPTRSGKGVGTIIPNLLTADRSVLCIDPKGENARVTARARARFGPVHVLDPFGVSGHPSGAFNPMEALDPYGLDVAEDAAVLAEALVYDPPGQAGDAHWNEEAKALIAGVILHVVSSEPSDRRNLATVREHLTTAPAAFKQLLDNMAASAAAGGLVARAANRQLGKSDREAAGVLSSAQRHTHFLDSPRMTAVMGRSDFSFADLKTGVATVYLVLPPDRLGVYGRWLRLLVSQAVTDMARSPAKPPSPVLFLLDEFAALGRLEPVERAFGLMAGYGMQLWPILQDLHQLRSAYGERHGTFLSNAGLVQIFNVADVDTASWVSRSIGNVTESYETTSESITDSPGHLFSTRGTSTSHNVAKRELLTPDEVMRLDAGTKILLRQGRRPALARKVRYYEDREFAGLYDAA